MMDCGNVTKETAMRWEKLEGWFDSRSDTCFVSLSWSLYMFFKFGTKVVNRCSNRQRARLVVFCMIEPFIIIPAYTFTCHCWARAFFRNGNWAEVTMRAQSENELLRSLCRLPHNIFLYHKAVVSPVCK